MVFKSTSESSISVLCSRVCVLTVVSPSVSVTEFVGYGELQQLWRSLGRLPENLVKIYLAQIALALGKIGVVASCRTCFVLLLDVSV